MFLPALIKDIIIILRQTVAAYTSVWSCAGAGGEKFLLQKCIPADCSHMHTHSAGHLIRDQHLEIEALRQPWHFMDVKERLTSDGSGFMMRTERPEGPGSSWLRWQPLVMEKIYSQDVTNILLVNQVRARINMQHDDAVFLEGVWRFNHSKLPDLISFVIA